METYLKANFDLSPFNDLFLNIMGLYNRESIICLEDPEVEIKIRNF